MIKSVALVCVPRCDESAFSDEVHVILNLDLTQITRLLANKAKLKKAAALFDVDEDSFNLVEMDDDLTFWMKELPEQINWLDFDDDDTETLEGNIGDEDLQWRVFPDVDLDEDKMNMDMEPLDVSSVRMSMSGLSFSAYLKHNTHRFETDVITWDDLANLRKRFAKSGRPVKLKK